MLETLNIITITKNNLKGLLATIESTKNLRSNHNIHQIIVDSSTVEVQNKIKEFIINENNIFYIWQEPLGISSAFNLGLSLSKSEWVWFLNGGDLSHPTLNIDNFIYTLSTSNADALIFQIELMKSHERLNHPPLWNLWPPIYPNWIPHPATIIKKRLFDLYGLFDKDIKITMDGELWLKFFSQAVTVDLISIPIAVFNTTGISNTQLKANTQEVIIILKRNLYLLIKRAFSGFKIIFLAFIHLYLKKWFKKDI